MTNNSSRFIADAIWHQRHELARVRPATRALHDALRAYMPPDHPGDLPFHEWGQLMAAALEFAPDLIVEVGRGFGNSTLTFTQAANLLKCDVVSICLHPFGESYAAVLPATTNEWFAPLSVYEGDVREFNFEKALGNAQRVLVFWDAHGFDVAECMLGGLMPLVADRQHLVLMHDIGDARHQDAESYNGFGVWKGEELWPGPMIRLGHVFATVQQAVSIVDFTSRNRISLHSVAHSLHTRFAACPNDARELRDVLGNFFEMRSLLAWFTLNESAGPYFFPRFNASLAA